MAASKLMMDSSLTEGQVKSREINIWSCQTQFTVMTKMSMSRPWGHPQACLFLPIPLGVPSPDQGLALASHDPALPSHENHWARQPHVLALSEPWQLYQNASCHLSNLGVLPAPNLFRIFWYQVRVLTIEVFLIIQPFPRPKKHFPASAPQTFRSCSTLHSLHQRK